MLESTGRWNKEKTLAESKGYQALVATDKCVRVTPNINLHILESIYKMVYNSTTTYRTEAGSKMRHGKK